MNSSILAYQKLTLDSEIFGFQVAKITATQIPDATKLQQTLEKLEAEGIKLVYLSVDSLDSISNENAAAQKGFLADKKVHYRLDMRKSNFGHLHDVMFSAPDEVRIKPYPKHLPPTKQLYNVGVQGGGHSRFYRDEYIPVRAFEKMYHRMMDNYINRSLADQVLVLTQKEHNYDPQAELLGVLVLAESPDGEGVAHLLSISKAKRAQKLGFLMFAHGATYFRSCGYNYIHAYTQVDNLRACHVYEGFGFDKLEVQNVYHFHLGGLEKDSTPRPKL
eukprot:TRINITY_DN5298_c0_g1_i1.p1 TRINITY_DN5298_c0_g1~~TRINITY_DN5298_c0_g1_i1.p1  ORF type:complete len:275 (+),score=72.08 TRINITY_DN5298_c0_g1_i1:40-864(+)